MNDEPDILRESLYEATLAVLLGSTNVHLQNVDMQGNLSHYTVSIPSAFAERIRYQAFSGNYDTLIAQAMEKVDPSEIAKHIEHIFAKEVIIGLEKRDQWSSAPNWLQGKVKEIAIAACTEAMKNDPELADILRTKIGMEVDRNRVGISVNLSDPEGT